MELSSWGVILGLIILSLLSVLVIRFGPKGNPKDLVQKTGPRDFSQVEWSAIDALMHDPDFQLGVLCILYPREFPAPIYDSTTIGADRFVVFTMGERYASSLVARRPKQAN